jgi:hypothetical protein
MAILDSHSESRGRVDRLRLILSRTLSLAARVQFKHAVKKMAAGALVLLPAFGPAVPAHAAAGEYEIKAAFLFNFARFVEWPPGVFSGPRDPIHLCLLGSVPLDEGLEQVVQGKTIGGRELQVEHLYEPALIKGCQILFVSGTQQQFEAELRNGGNSPGILTVGESDDFARAGGVINFVLQGKRINFEINVDAADRAGLKISSKLLSLARIVRDNPSGWKD